MIKKNGTQKPRKSQNTLTSREIISVRSVKSVWDLKLRFPQKFEDERGLASGIVMLIRIIACLCELSLQFLVTCNPTTKVPCCSVCTCSREIGYS